MARRTRDFDWNDHPFGPPETWPQSLRSALSICLNSAFPTAIYWGPDLRLLYNDAWAPIPGPRHPDALGARAQDVWSDIWHIIEPQFAELVQSGEGLFVEDQLLPMRRYGFEEETYWNYSFTPLRAEDGRIVGIFNSGSETTENVIQRRNAEVLVALNQELRTCETTVDALDLAVSRLGQLMKATRVGIRQRTVLNDKPGFALTCEWRPDGIAPSEDVLGLSHLSAEQSDALLSGKIVRLSTLDPDLHATGRRFLEDIGISSLLVVPWVENGQTASVIYIQNAAARAYNALDVSTVEKVLETTMGWIERERHRERELVMAAEIDHRARNMLAVIQSITRMTNGKDVDELKDKLGERFKALSRVHSLLGRNRWTSVEFRDIVEEELAPLGPEVKERVTLRGPRLMLSAQEAQLFAMILHELTTNALKYGSMRQDGGTLSVTWSIDGNGHMDLDWVESGVAAGTGSDSKGPNGGFGSVLLSNVVQNQLGGEVKRTVTEHGIAYNFVLSLHRQADAPAEETAFATHDRKPAEAALSVMVVEDDAIISLDLAETLASEGYDVFGQFGNVETALDALRRAAPDLALLDADLGGRSSAPIAEALCAQSVPFVVVSGNGTSFADGDPRTVAPRIEKPISNGELLSVIRQATGHT